MRWPLCDEIYNQIGKMGNKWIDHLTRCQILYCETLFLIYSKFEMRSISNRNACQTKKHRNQHTFWTLSLFKIKFFHCAVVRSLNYECYEYIFSVTGLCAFRKYRHKNVSSHFNISNKTNFIFYVFNRFRTILISYKKKVETLW